MGVDDRFGQINDLVGELKEEPGVHLLDIDTIDIDADDDAVEVTADVRGVCVQAWHDEDGVLNVYSEDEGFEDPDDVHDHLNARENSEMDVEALVDEAESLRSRYGNAALSDYRDHLRGGT